MEREARTVVDARSAGSALIDYISARYTYLDRGEWHRAIAEGSLTVNGRAAEPGGPVAAGDLIAFAPGSFAEPEADTRIRILHEDAARLVVEKPPNLPAHPGGRYFKRTLWYILKERGFEPRIVTRLDRETSGLVLAAKTAAEARRLGALSAEGRIEKGYLALVHGNFPADLAARGVLVSDRESSVRKKRAFISEDDPGFPEASRTGERCETVFALAGAADGKSMVQARLLTGRTHQIRATLHSLGYPVVGDKLYGLDPTLFLRFIGGTLSVADRAILELPHQALHCARLSFKAEDGRTLAFESLPPFGLCATRTSA